MLKAFESSVITSLKKSYPAYQVGLEKIWQKILRLTFSLFFRNYAHERSKRKTNKYDNQAEAYEKLYIGFISTGRSEFSFR